MTPPSHARSQLAKRGMLVTFGITPTHPETGFGYIECGEMVMPASHDQPAAYRAQRFVEKPPLLTARQYLAAGNYLWNSGMFAFTAGAIVAAFGRHAPGVLSATRPIAAGLSTAANGMVEIDPALFAAVPDISIDYAVMEPAATAGEVAVVRGTFDWSDVGSWQAVAALTEADDQGNADTASGLPSRRAAPTSIRRIASSRRSASRTWSSSTRPTPCSSRIAIICSASRMSSAS